MNNKLLFMDAVFENTYMWYFDNGIQSICKMDLDFEKVEIVSNFAGAKLIDIKRIFAFENNFYMTQDSSTDILEYDRISYEFKEVKNTQKEVSGRHMTYMYRDEIWFFPVSLNGVLYVYDIRGKKYYQKKEFEKFSKQCFNNAAYSIGYFSFADGRLWFVVYGTNQYVKYDFLKNTCEVYRTSNKSNKLKGICAGDNQFWLTLYDSENILCINNGAEKYVELNVGNTYSWLYSVKEYIVVLPRHGSDVVMIRKTDSLSQIVPLEVEDKDMRTLNNRSNFAHCKEYGGYLYIFPYGVGQFFRINMGQLKSEKINLDYDMNKYKAVKTNLLKNVLIDREQIVFETERIGCDVFIDFISEFGDENDGQKKVCENGKDIHNYIT